MRGLKELKFGAVSFLVASGLLASILNFYSFLLLPVLKPSEQLGTFIQHNYLGGSYMAIIGGSVIPMSIFLLNNGGRVLFRSYFVISFLILFIVVVVGAKFTFPPYSYYALGAGILLHFQGLPLALMIRQERTKTASFCILVQPLMFAVLLTFEHLLTSSNLPWIYFWLIASAISAMFFFYLAGWRELIFFINRDEKTNIKLNSLLSRMFIASTFPIFLQLELIFVGTYSSIDLTEFAILQKLYISVSISLFSNLSVLLIAKDLKANGSLSIAPDIRAVLMGLLAVIVTTSVGFALALLDRGERLDIAEIFTAGLVSCAFTVCSYINLRQIQVKPLAAAISFVTALAVYALLFFNFNPMSVIDLMLLGVGYFGTYILVSCVIESLPRITKKAI
jgi:hypothetical protein